MSNYSYITKREIPYDPSGLVKIDLSLAKNGISGIDINSTDVISIVNLDIPIRRTDDRFDYDNYGTLLEYATDQSKLKISDLNMKVQLYYNFDFFSPVNPLSTNVVALKNTTETELKLEDPFVSDYIKVKHYQHSNQWKQKTIFDIKQLASDSKFVFSSNNVPVFSLIPSQEISNYGKPMIYSNLNDSLKLSSIRLKYTDKPETNLVFRFFDMFMTDTSSTSDGTNPRFLNLVESEIYGSKTTPKTPYDFTTEIDYLSFLLKNMYMSNNSFFTGSLTDFSNNKDIVYYIGYDTLLIKGGAKYYVTLEFFDNVMSLSKWWRSTGRNIWNVNIKTIGQKGDGLCVSTDTKVNDGIFKKSFPRTQLVELSNKLSTLTHISFPKDASKEDFNGYFFGCVRNVGDKQFHLKSIPDQINILKDGILSPGYFRFLDQVNPLFTSYTDGISVVTSVVQSKYRENSSIPLSTVKADLNENRIKFPWMTYVNISKENPTIENDSSQYLIYNTLADDTYVTSANRHFQIAGNVFVHNLDTKSIINGVEYVQLTHQNPAQFRPVSSRRVTNLNSSVISYSSSPIKAVIKSNGGYASYHNLLIHIRNINNTVTTRGMSLLPSYKIIANNHSGSKNPSYFNITNTEFQDFFKKYPNSSYKYVVNVNSVTFPSLIGKMKDGNDVDKIHLIAFGLTDAKKIRFNDTDQQHLGFINLSEAESWSNQKLLDSRYVVTLGSEDDNSSSNLHRSTAFETVAWKDLTTFSIQLVDSNGDILVFNGTKNYYPSFDISIFAVPNTSKNKRRRIS